jgi:predicted DNA-binding WGR domain protein
MSWLCGRWEFVDGSSSKFWQCSFEPTTSTYLTEWGRIGKPSQAMRGGLSETEARKKAMEKERKGYVRVGDVTDTVGNRAGRAAVSRDERTSSEPVREEHLTGLGRRVIR